MTHVYRFTLFFFIFLVLQVASRYVPVEFMDYYHSMIGASLLTYVMFAIDWSK